MTINLEDKEWSEIWQKLDSLQTFLITKSPERAQELGQIMDKLIQVQ